MRAALVTRYNTVKPFLALLGESKALSAASGASGSSPGSGRFWRWPGGR
ncbi:hypothetical protein NKH18_02715 [Streptomyces sp. M10(2022)]